MSGKDLAVHPEWSAWLAENLARGCERKVLVETLLANGFSRATIERALARPVLGTATPGSVDVRDAPVLKRPDNGRFVLKLNSSRLDCNRPMPRSVDSSVRCRASSWMR